MELLTLQEIADRLNMPASTVRYYARTFREYMPGVKVGRYLKYEPEAIEVVKVIAEGFNSNQQQQQVRGQLQEKFALNIEQNTNEQEPGTTAATTEQQQQQTDIVKYEHAKLTAALRDEIYFLRGQVQELQNDNRELTRRLLQLEAPRRPGLLQRIFSRQG